MKIGLLLVESNKQGCFNKDLAGGMGTRTIIGNSWQAKLLQLIKKRNVKLPLISMAYLAAIFTEQGHQVKYLKNQIEEADLILIPSSIVDFKEELHFARRIKKYTKAKVGFYGPFASVRPEIFLKQADFVIKDEVELVASRIAKTGKIPIGLVEGGVIENLDNLPFPNWQFFPLNEYSYAPVIKRKNFVTILTSRGCPFSCGYYCPYVLAQGGKWRFRSVENIIEEMKYLVKSYKVRGLDFRDPNFTLDRERTQKLALAMIKNKLDFEWSCETHLNVLDENLLKLLYKAGLRNINVGIESADPEILSKSFRQKGSIEHQEKIIRFCEKIGITVATFYIFGYPNDTQQTIQRTIDYASYLNTTVAQFTICTPYPGTKFYEEIKTKITSKDWEDFNAYTPVFRHQKLNKKKLLQLKEQAWVNYYFSPRYIISYLKRFLKKCF